MTIAVYKAGNTHIVRGIHCEVHRLPNAKLEWAKANGFYMQPEDIDGIDDTVPANSEPVEPDDFPDEMADNPKVNGAVSEPELEPVNETELRAQAKALGIASSHNKKLDTLVEEINARLQT